VSIPGPAEFPPIAAMTWLKNIATDCSRQYVKIASATEIKKGEKDEPYNKLGEDRKPVH